MKIDVEVISGEMIKPSTPTPDHLHRCQFSFLDQISPSVYIPLIYFFDLDDQELSKQYISNHLKTSLSEVLTRYYPLAGRVKDSYVDCNDKGVLFSEAQVSCQLSQILQESFPSYELDRFLPDVQVSNVCLAIQVNFLTCGNVAIGARISHKIADGSSLITFIKNWAATARGDTDNFCAEFVAAKLFPPIDVVGGFDRNINPTDMNVVMKKFVFSDSVITALRAKYAHKTSTENQIYPTRVEALSSFIWCRFQASTQPKVGLEKPLLLIHAVNLRKMMDQPLPDDSFGNFFRPAITISSQDTGEDYYSLVNKLRDSISRIDKSYVKKLQDGSSNEYDLMRRMAERFNKGEFFTFNYTSLCRYPVYEADFGWRRPVWVAWGGLPYKNLNVLMDTKSGDGIEAWIHLNEEDMAKFETDQELLNCLSLS
ncbi:hypothetical protein Dsin_024111 [Dipteronia sinensis]|uniref:Uncharacterized protein n=1 Tax=Dipteronia sinensis TaxID=43782 RepID=A0AAE0E1J2_9ROSI|nr:hypothetical protein Dsin_024111 [Dipteronia sinensis]